MLPVVSALQVQWKGMTSIDLQKRDTAMKMPSLLTAITLITVAMPSLARGSDKMFVLVTGGTQPAFSCKMQPNSQPPAIANELMRVKVSVRGGTAPFHWRLPLYQKNAYNGYNDMAVARIGDANPNSKNEFYIDLSATDLEKLTTDRLTLSLSGRDFRETSCSMPVSGFRQLALNRPPVRIDMVEGKLAR